MGAVRSLVAGVLSLGLILTVPVAFVLQLSNETLFRRGFGSDLLGVTQTQIGTATMAFIVVSVALAGLVFVVSRSIGTTLRALGVGLLFGGAPPYVVGFVLKNRPEPVLSALSYGMRRFVLNLSEFSHPFVDTVTQQSLVLLIAGVGLLVIARFVGASSS